MQYNVIGLMSGSSLDGLDLVFTQLNENRGAWTFQIIHADTRPYSPALIHDLKTITNQPAAKMLLLHTSYGRHIADEVNQFIERHDLSHQVHFIASHGHTIFHEPHYATTFQLGCGATVAALTGLPVIADLRSMDVALGGQGAPIVPIGDRMLFGEFGCCLNIGGIVNISFKDDDAYQAFDVCTGNQMLNIIAEREGLEFDQDGQLARQGAIIPDVLEDMLKNEYYATLGPKSLSNAQALELVFPYFNTSDHQNRDLLRTGVAYIAAQVKKEVQRNLPSRPATMLATGGGALNTFLMEEIARNLKELNVEVVIPPVVVVKFKEALIMALIGALRWREETNISAATTGASRDTISGCIHMGHSFNADK